MKYSSLKKEYIKRKLLEDWIDMVGELCVCVFRTSVIDTGFDI
jgi:hypothetical protein